MPGEVGKSAGDSVFDEAGGWFIGDVEVFDDGLQHFPIFTDDFRQAEQRLFQGVYFVEEIVLGIADGLVFVVHAFEADVGGCHVRDRVLVG